MRSAIHDILVVLTCSLGPSCAGSVSETSGESETPTTNGEPQPETATGPSAPEISDDEPETAPTGTGDVPTLSPFELDRRGDEHLFAGRFDEAIADFDAFLAAEPLRDPHHWRRGIAYYYAGRFEDGAAQFVRHRTVNPNDVENAAWHFLCVARAEGPEAARDALLPVGPDQRDPMAQVYELYAGRAEPADVLAAAEASPQYDALFFAHLYLGLYHEVLGAKVEARHHMSLAATTHGRSHYMGAVAKVHATLLER